jgi:hypothetical protein
MSSDSMITVRVKITTAQHQAVRLAALKTELTIQEMYAKLAAPNLLNRAVCDELRRKRRGAA